MSYSVRYSKINAFFEGENYSFSKPEVLTQDSMNLIKRILFSYNSEYLKNEGNGLEHGEIPNGVYFFVLDEGAVLFRVGAYRSEICYSAAMIGMFFSTEYVATAWFLIDKLVRLIMSDTFYSIEDEMLYEDELDELLVPDGLLDLNINPDGETSIYSFAISNSDPELKEVHFIKQTDEVCMVDSKTEKRKHLGIEDILGLRSISPEDTLEDIYDQVMIGRNIEVKNRLFRWKADSCHHWGIKETGVSKEGGFHELECIEDGKIISFKDLTGEVDSIIKG